MGGAYEFAPLKVCEEYSVYITGDAHWTAEPEPWLVNTWPAVP